MFSASKDVSHSWNSVTLKLSSCIVFLSVVLSHDAHGGKLETVKASINSDGSRQLLCAALT